MKQRRIAIIGTGTVGMGLAEKFVERNICDVLYLDNRSEIRLQSVIQSLQILAHIANSKVKIKRLLDEDFSHIDLAIIAVKCDYDKRDILRSEPIPLWLRRDFRHIGIRRDITLIHSACRRLNQFRGLIVVISNPIDIITTFVGERLTNCSGVLGLGVTLDAARLAFVLNSTLKIKVERKDCPVGGEHGFNLVPFKSMWAPFLLKRVSSKEITSIVARSSKIGPSIVSGLGYTVHDCVAVFCDDIEQLMKSITSSKEQVSFYSVYKNNVAIGVPSKISKLGCMPVVELLNRSEQDKILRRRSHLEKIIKNIRDHNWFISPLDTQ